MLSKLGKYLSFLLALVYLLCMVVFPWTSNGADWEYVQKVWDRWQTFNAGALAFFASVLAFNISAFNAEQQRKRLFTAARSFLPHALDELNGYYEQSAKLFLEVYARLKANDPYAPTALEARFPVSPEGCKEIFNRCIEHAPSDVGAYLANILMELQVHRARTTAMSESLSQKNHLVVTRENVRANLARLARLYAFSTKLFPFARGFAEFDKSEISWPDFEAAYGNLFVRVDDVDGLRDQTMKFGKYQ